MPLLAASCSGDTTPGGGGVTFNMPLMLPDCAEGSLLTTDSAGNAKCASAPTGDKIPLPSNCTDNQALNSDGKTLTCVDKANGTGNPNNDKLTALDTKLTDLTTRATNLKNGGGGSGYLSFAGVSVNTYSGHIKLRAQAYLADVVQDNGILAASNVCAKDFGAGARICTVGDIVSSTINGKLVRTTLMTEDAWIYNASFQNPLTSSPINGLGDNCAGYTYETADAKWMGTSFRWRAAESADAAGKGDVSPSFFLVGCNTSRKIACCK